MVLNGPFGFVLVISLGLFRLKAPLIFTSPLCPQFLLFCHYGYWLSFSDFSPSTFVSLSIFFLLQSFTSNDSCHLPTIRLMFPELSVMILQIAATIQCINSLFHFLIYISCVFLIPYFCLLNRSFKRHSS